jgi:hypothetical protein
VTREASERNRDVIYVLTVKSDNLDSLEVALVHIWRIVQAAGLASPSTKILHPGVGDWRLSVSFSQKQDRDHVRTELGRHARTSGYGLL